MGTVLAHGDKDLTEFPFLRHLAVREELVRNGKMSTIIFIRDRNARGQEISGYIDYGHRLKIENFEPYFERKRDCCLGPRTFRSTTGTHSTRRPTRVPISRSCPTTNRACSSRTNEIERS